GDAGRKDKWMDCFKKLSVLKELNGNCTVHPNEDKKLAAWTYTQQRLKRIGKLSKEKVDLLDSLKFPWREQVSPRGGRGREKMRFQELLEKLKEYKKCNGDVKVNSRKDLNLYNALLRHRRMR